MASSRPCLDGRSRRSLTPPRERGSREAARSARSSGSTRGNAKLTQTSQVYLGKGATLPAHEPEEGEGDDDGDHEAAAAGADLVDADVHFLHELVVFVAHRHVLIGPELPCKVGMGMMMEGRDCVTT